MEFKVYIAAPFNNRDAARELRSRLLTAGIGCTSRWIDSHKEELDLLTPVDRRQEAEADLHDVRLADALVLLAGEGPSTSGGMHVEFGYALSLHTPIMVVGGGQSIFHYLPQVVRVDTLDEAESFLRREFYGATN